MSCKACNSFEILNCSKCIKNNFKPLQEKLSLIQQQIKAKQTKLNALIQQLPEEKLRFLIEKEKIHKKTENSAKCK